MTTTPVRSRAARLALATALTLGGAGVVVATTVAAPPAGAATPVRTRTSAVAAASAYASAHGYTVGIAVLDTVTGELIGKNSSRTFATESVVKTMIATRILLQGRMHGSTASRAYKMITQSDDTIASSFYGSVGGDGLITWIKNHYKIPNLGSQPTRSGWWGNTKITPAGLVTFYSRIKKDKKVGPWLINAMHHATTHGSDGVYQYFGIPSATKGAGIKQGWGADYSYSHPTADYNSTGFVNSDRYAVALLAMGPLGTYGKAIGDLLTQVAKRVLPGGRFPDPLPIVTQASPNHGPVTGGTRITVRGHYFTGVTGVTFGGRKGTAVHTVNSRTLTVSTPTNVARPGKIVVLTNHGDSSRTRYFGYGRAPTVRSLSPSTGSTNGGTHLTVTGTDFRGGTVTVYVGKDIAKQLHRTSTSVVVVAPAHAAGTRQVRVRTWYGLSTPVAAGVYHWTAPVTPVPPTTTQPAPKSAASSDPASTDPATGAPEPVPTSSATATPATGR